AYCPEKITETSRAPFSSSLFPGVLPLRSLLTEASRLALQATHQPFQLFRRRDFAVIWQATTGCQFLDNRKRILWRHELTFPEGTRFLKVVQIPTGIGPRPDKLVVPSNAKRNVFNDYEWVSRKLLEIARCSW